MNHGELLAERIAKAFEIDMQPENSCQVLLQADGGTQWVTRIDGVEARQTHAPGVGLLRGLGAGLMGILPIEEQL